jgi:hypothetical protein
MKQNASAFDLMRELADFFRAEIQPKSSTPSGRKRFIKRTGRT